MAAKKKKAPSDPMMAVLANIQKQMGIKDPTPFARFGSIERKDIPVVSFGIKQIDDASYCGGLPRGKMVEIFGNESSGKSLLTLYLIAEAQRQGLECALIDIEQSFDPVWAAQHGVNVDSLVYSNSFDCGEQALEYAFRLCDSGAFGVVVIDSTAALTPRAELEGSLDQAARVGAQAQMMSRGCRKIVKACGTTDTLCIFINQVRLKIGVMYGNPETTPGGKALPFYSHVRIKVQKKQMIKVKEGKEDIIVGQKSEIKFIKNKVARPFGKCDFDIIFDPKSLNPVVMLASLLKSLKVLVLYGGLYKIEKEVFDNAKRLDTGCATFPEIADWMIQNEYVVPLIETAIERYEDDPTLEVDNGPIDGKILEMLEDKSKIISPNESEVEISFGDVSNDPEDVPEEEEPEDQEDQEVLPE